MMVRFLKLIGDFSTEIILLATCITNNKVYVGLTLTRQLAKSIERGVKETCSAIHTYWETDGGWLLTDFTSSKETGSCLVGDKSLATLYILSTYQGMHLKGVGFADGLHRRVNGDGLPLLGELGDGHLLHRHQQVVGRIDDRTCGLLILVARIGIAISTGVGLGCLQGSLQNRHLGGRDIAGKGLQGVDTTLASHLGVFISK